MLVVDAASGSVQERVTVDTPGAAHHGLHPGLMETQVGRVDETTQDEVSEVSDEVIERHPTRERGTSVSPGRYVQELLNQPETEQMSV